METTAAVSLEQQVQNLEQDIKNRKEELLKLRRQLPPQDVADYTLRDPGGQEVKLSQLFNSHAELILIHNMGRGCPYCTLWADGFNGLLPHLQNRAAFLLASPDAPDVQRDFAASRGWKLRMVSTAGSSFTKDLGYQDEQDRLVPGVSVFTKDASGKLQRVSRAVFGPGDSYCVAWDLFDLLPGGSEGWGPKLVYK